MLVDKKLLITGVITRDSIAWEAPRQARVAGAEVGLTGFGRARRLTERAARVAKAALEATARYLGWDGDDRAPVAGAILFLLLDLAPAITGEILHVDVGFHAMGAPLSSRSAALEGAPA